MADKYWVGGSGNSNDTAHYSLTSGGAGSAGVPSASERVIFDQNSDTGAGFTFTVNAAFVCLDFDNSAVDQVMTWAGSSTMAVSGGLNLKSNTVRTYTGALTFNATASKNVTTNGVGLGSNVTLNGVSGVWNLQDNFSTTGTGTLTNGRLNLNDKRFKCTSWSSSNSNVRGINSGSLDQGVIEVTASAATIWNTSTNTNFTVTGNPQVEASYSGPTGTRTWVGLTGNVLNHSISLKLTAGSDNVDISANTTRDLIVTGFTGTIAFASGTSNIFGDFVLPASWTGSITWGGNLLIHGPGATQHLDTNGYSLAGAVGIDAPSSTISLTSDFKVAAGNNCKLTNGTLNLNGKVLTCGNWSFGSGTKELQANGGAIKTLDSGSSAFDGSTNKTGLTLTKGSAYGSISMDSASAKSFDGGALTWPFALNQGGAGALTIASSNNLAGLTNSTQPATITTTAGTTQTFSVAPSVAGTSGNLITLNSSAASNYTWSMAPGLTANVSYCTISRSQATGGGTWNAPTSSGNVDNGNNSGWNFHSAFSLSCDKATFSYSGQTVGAKTAASIAAGKASFSYAGQAAVLRYATSLPAAKGDFTYTGQGLAFVLERRLSAAFASYAFSGQACGVNGALSLSMGRADFSVVGEDAALVFRRSLQAANAVFALNGQALAFKGALNFPLAKGDFSYTGQVLQTRAARKLAANSGTFAVTGQSLRLLRGVRMTAAAASFAYTGQAAGINGRLSLAMGWAPFSYAGQTASPKAQRALQLANAVFTLNGQALALRLGRMVSAAAGAFSYSGQALGPKVNKRLAMAAASYSYVGQAAVLPTGYRMPVQSGAFTYAGQDLVLRHDRILQASAGTFAYTGQAIGLAHRSNLGTAITGALATTALIGAFAVTSLIGRTRNDALEGAVGRH